MVDGLRDVVQFLTKRRQPCGRGSMPKLSILLMGARNRPVEPLAGFGEAAACAAAFSATTAT
ncbi:hypothetical protein ACFQ60_03255 [Streptomyces zhihengii]